MKYLAVVIWGLLFNVHFLSDVPYWSVLDKAALDNVWIKLP
jgi:hypothetical protein